MNRNVVDIQQLQTGMPVRYIIESTPYQHQLVFMQVELEFGLFVFVREENQRTLKTNNKLHPHQFDTGLEWKLGYIGGR